MMAGGGKVGDRGILCEFEYKSRAHWVPHLNTLKFVGDSQQSVEFRPAAYHILYFTRTASHRVSSPPANVSNQGSKFTTIIMTGIRIKWWERHMCKREFRLSNTLGEG